MSRAKLDDKFIRSRFLDFFKQRGHAVIPSASVIPENDPTVLFTTAGMHPLVPYFLGRSHPAGNRVTNCQKCIRTSDIEAVGDATHLTFFEMLGNWSLGDYFKEESLRWSFEFLTDPDCLNIPKELIYVSVFAGDENAPRDSETAEIWQSLGIPESRIAFLSAEHNWWAAGPEGPCGPDSEIFVDTVQLAGGPADPNAVPGVDESERFFEIWNNVFMCYNRVGSKITPLPSHNVDTGMGLERTLAVLNGVKTVYETSCFQPIIKDLLSRSKATENESPEVTFATRVVSDHLRTSVFILGDENGVTPSNQGQGYVLRRLIRRAIRFCERLGLPSEQFVAAAGSVIEHYEEAYPDLSRNQDRIFSELKEEAERFRTVLGKGVQMLDKQIAESKAAGEANLPGEFVFRLYDTYGFPVEFTEELVQEQGLSVDKQDFQNRCEEHRKRSRTESAKGGLADESIESTRYHTATHLLHAALRDILGPHVEQRGSNITKDRMRFDFSHPAALTKEEKQRVEEFVQKAIDRGLEIQSELMKYEDAKKSGAIGLFEDRYGNDVSVYTIGDVSKEVCGGPHVENTRELGTFKITKEQSSSSGVRRIRAVLK